MDSDTANPTWPSTLLLPENVFGILEPEWDSLLAEYDYSRMAGSVLLFAFIGVENPPEKLCIRPRIDFTTLKTRGKIGDFQAGKPVVAGSANTGEKAADENIEYLPVVFLFADRNVRATLSVGAQLCFDFMKI